MRVSELSRASGVSVASIKFYLREGLLPGGTATASNQADYDDEHVRRLRLIRALIDVGELPIATVRTVLAAVDDESTKMHDAFGAVMHGLDDPPPADPAPPVAAALAEVRRWLRARGWKIMANAPAPYALAELLVTLRQFDISIAVSDLDGAADAAERSAELEVGYALAKPDRTAAVENMLIGTVVYERVLAEVRRLALEAVSARLGAGSRATTSRPPRESAHVS
jgi:DNA-binding transcriptional MerR regulator